MMFSNDTGRPTKTCEYPGCDKVTIAMVIDMENNWWCWCGEHAVADLTSTRERGA